MSTARQNTLVSTCGPEQMAAMRLLARIFLDIFKRLRAEKRGTYVIGFQNTTDNSLADAQPLSI